jgi:ferredoxin
MSTLDRLLRRDQTSGQTLKIDPVECEGIGQCAVAASRIIGLDRWGYPIVPTGELNASDVAQAGRAVKACPKAALWLEEL